MLICEIKPEVYEVLEKEGVVELIGKTHIHDRFDLAVEHSRILVQQINRKNKSGATNKSKL